MWSRRSWMCVQKGKEKYSFEQKKHCFRSDSASPLQPEYHPLNSGWSRQFSVQPDDQNGSAQNFPQKDAERIEAEDLFVLTLFTGFMTDHKIHAARTGSGPFYDSFWRILKEDNLPERAASKNKSSMARSGKNEFLSTENRDA